MTHPAPATHRPHRFEPTPIVAYIHPVSPVHVGGEEADAIDLLRGTLNDRPSLHYLNVPRFISALDEHAIHQLADELRRGVPFQEALGHLASNPAHGSALQSSLRRSVYLHPATDPGNRPLRLFPFGGVAATPYLPGSSVKGSLRTALEAWLLTRHRNLDGLARAVDGLAETPRNLDAAWRTCLGRAIRVSDSFEPVRGTYAVTAFRGRRNGWNSSAIPQNIEAWLPAGLDPSRMTEPAEIELTFVTGPGLLPLPLDDVARAANDYYAPLFEKNMQQVGRVSREGARNVERELEDLRKRHPHGFLLRLGWGTGSETIGGGRAGTRTPREPSTFWLVELSGGRYPLGWAYCVPDTGGRG